MSVLSMATELTGIVSRMPIDYSFTCVQRAILEVYRQNAGWSFLTFEANWTTPSWVQAGTVTTTQGSNTVVFDATASAAINAIGFQPSPVTKRQFRIGVGTIYNIWQWDGVNTATIDRPYQEASAIGQGYAIFQCYYASPVQDFRGWCSIRDMLNWNDLYFNKSRAWLDTQDPQRVIYFIPTHVVYYQPDLNPTSSTYGYPMFEMWGVPTYQLTYQLYGYRSGFINQNGQDIPLVGVGLGSLAVGAGESETLPIAIGEDAIMAKARWYAYEWAEANREGNDRRNYGRLQDTTEKEFGRLTRGYRKQDRALFDAFHVKFRRSRAFPNYEPQYNSIAGVASPGAP